jgi:hypothetical protein
MGDELGGVLSRTGELATGSCGSVATGRETDFDLGMGVGVLLTLEVFPELVLVEANGDSTTMASGLGLMTPSLSSSAQR